MANKNIEEQSAQDIEKAIDNDQNAIPYTPLSSLPSMGTVMPLNMAGEILQAQFSFAEQIPDIDDYLVKKLKYSSKFALSQALGAEQADATAFAINQIEKNKGFILADMAGIGKGRVNASILRYAFVNGYLPIFITESAGLFSALYRDIKDIGGIVDGGKFPATIKDCGKPFILNGYKNGELVKGFDEKGKKTQFRKPGENSIVDSDGKEIIVPLEQKKIKEIIRGKKMPNGFDYMFLTYSQLSVKSTTTKVLEKLEYIKRLIEAYDGKVILCIDECHNATGVTSTTGQAIQELVQMVQGVLFSSATFSKRPDNMYIYALKTDILTSPLGYDDLIKVIKEGGERLIENLATNLAACNQLIRRERTYDNCDVQYNYMDDESKPVLFEKYDKALSLYKDLQKFFTSARFAITRKAVIDRVAKENKIELCWEPKPKKKTELEEWCVENAGKYYVGMFTAGDMKRSQFQFIETLLFSVKAEFVVDQVIGNKLKNIKGQLTYKDWENISVKTKEVFKSNRKPVIAVRNTLEGVYYNLGLEVGSVIDKADFSMYVYALAKGALEGTLTFKEIKKDGSKGKEISEDFEILDKDFEDKGKEYKEKLDKIQAIDLDIPLSPIDYIIDKIESTPRPAWDENGEGNPYFKVGEVTGRKFRLKKLKNGKYELTLNEKDKNISVAFKKFNSGVYDVLLINESGSTGQDAHSSEKFIDQRPRAMIIHQVELDVNTEVQKRGRINRTGMLNYPTYIYAISRIPSEIRRLLMLVRKLRSLDANTTGNQKQSAKLSTIKDSNGNTIQDIVNKYGDECLEEFLSIPSNSQYLKYKPSDDQKKASTFDEFVVQSFIRNLEIGFCLEQEVFFNTINALYIEKLKDLGADYDLETTLSDYKAIIKTRIVRSYGNNTNPFDSSVYEEDDYVLAEDKPFPKQKVEDLILEFAKGKDPIENYNDFIKDYEKNFQKHLKEVIDDIPLPDFKDVKDAKEKKDLQELYNQEVLQATQREEEQHQVILNILAGKRVYTNSSVDVYNTPDVNDFGTTFYYELKSYVSKIVKNSQGTWYLVTEGWIKKESVTKEERILNPGQPILIPTYVEECSEVDEKGKPIVPKAYNNARFIGVKLLNTAKHKYSPMNIELVFCQLSGKNRVSFKPTKKGREVLEWVMSRSVTIETKRLLDINNWEIDPNRREVVRLFTGNILGAYKIAKDDVKRNDNYSPIIKFVKFTTADGSSIRLGIKLGQKTYVALNPDRAQVEYPLNSKKLVEDLKPIKYLRATNVEENFRLRKESGVVYLEVFGGTTRESKKKKYYNQCYDDSGLRDLTTSLGVRCIDTNMWYLPVDSNRNTYLKILSIYPFYVTSDTDMESLQKILSYIYSVTPFNIGISNVSSSETIKRTEEELKKLAEEALEKQETGQEGEYKYELMKPYSYLKDKLRDFSKFVKFQNDMAYLNRRANVREAISYELIPLDNTIADMVADTFEAISSDTEKIRLKTEVEKMVADGKDDYDIGEKVKLALIGKVLSVKNIFGTDYVEFIGEVFRKFVKGEVELPKKMDKKEPGKEAKRESRPLNLENAEEFIIHLNFKIKNR